MCRSFDRIASENYCLVMLMMTLSQNATPPQALCNTDNPAGFLPFQVDPSSPKDLERVRIYKPKRKEGVVERIEADGRGAIGKGMFKKDADISLYSGMKARKRPFPGTSTDSLSAS